MSTNINWYQTKPNQYKFIVVKVFGNVFALQYELNARCNPRENESFPEIDSQSSR